MTNLELNDKSAVDAQGYDLRMTWSRHHRAVMAITMTMETLP